jgi:hypothetical protein
MLVYSSGTHSIREAAVSTLESFGVMRWLIGVLMNLLLWIRGIFDGKQITKIAILIITVEATMMWLAMTMKITVMMEITMRTVAIMMENLMTKTTAVATTAKIGVLMARRSLTVRIILREMDLKRRGRARDRRR